MWFAPGNAAWGLQKLGYWVPRGLEGEAMGKELQMPLRETKTHRFHVERREFEGVFPSFSILFSGGKWRKKE